MVLVWSDLSCGDRECHRSTGGDQLGVPGAHVRRAGLVLPAGPPAWLGLETTSAEFPSDDCELRAGVPGYPTAGRGGSRLLGEKIKGRDWYENTYLPRISPLALIGLLYTIVLLFSLQGDQIAANPWAVAMPAVPLVIYFLGMFSIALIAAKMAGLSYAQSASVSFTAAGNNFELAIAVAIGTFGAASGQCAGGHDRPVDRSTGPGRPGVCHAAPGAGAVRRGPDLAAHPGGR